MRKSSPWLVPSPAGGWFWRRRDDAAVVLHEVLFGDPLHVRGSDFLDVRLSLAQEIGIVVEHGVLRHDHRALQRASLAADVVATRGDPGLLELPILDVARLHLLDFGVD